MSNIEETIKNADPIFYKGWKIFPTISPSNKIRVFAEKEGEDLRFQQRVMKEGQLEIALKYLQSEIDRLEEMDELIAAIEFLKADGRFPTAVFILEDSGLL